MVEFSRKGLSEDSEIELCMQRKQDWPEVKVEMQSQQVSADPSRGIELGWLLKVVLFVVLHVLVVAGCVCDIGELASFDWRQFQSNDSVESCWVSSWWGTSASGVMWDLVCVLVSQSCPTLCDSMDYSPPDPSIHGILQARILE